MSPSLPAHDDTTWVPPSSPRFSQVEDAFVASDRDTGRSRGFGFVTIEAEGAQQAISEVNETEFMGRTIRVNEAQPRGEGGGGKCANQTSHSKSEFNQGLLHETDGVPCAFPRR
eukprot:366229-Chlamydomonas_euryale.AAC.56